MRFSRIYPFTNVCSRLVCNRLFTLAGQMNFRFLIALFSLLTIGVRAQSYPVQVSAQLVPPFSGYLPDYASPGNDNLRIFITFMDFSQPSYDVKLKFKLSGNNVSIQSKSWYYAGPFTLEPGVPLMLSGTDFSGMLNAANNDYSGITLAQYNQSKVLPEGFYTIEVTAYDAANPLPIQVSNTGLTQAWMMLCDPPITNLPACGNEVPSSDPQFLTFSWTPLSMTAPQSALGTEYLFELWEVMPPNNSPGNVVQSTAPIYTTTTNLTMITYGIAEPSLQIGWTYVWRVRAYDLDGRALFRNNGYSQVCTFQFGDNSELLGNLAQLTLSAQVLTHRQARCTWDSLGAYASYHLEFRKLNTPNWFPVNTSNSNVRITSLEPLTQYEAQVHGIFPNGNDGPWSNIVTFTTPAQAVLNCGDASPPPAQQNFSPLTQASVGMIWQVGQFEMIVTQLNNLANPSGLYSGLGKIIMPLGVTLNVQYNNIQIGQDQIMYAGQVKAVTEGVSSWMMQWQMTYHYDTSYFFNGHIDSIYVNNGQIIIIDENGNQTTVPIDPNGGVLITDSNGNQWIVNADGTVTLVTGGFLLPLTNDTLNDQEMRIMKGAMTIIRNELSPQVVSTKESAMNTAEQNLQTHSDQQKQVIFGNNNQTQPPTQVDDKYEDIVFVEENADPNSPGDVLGSTYKTAQVEYYAAKVLLIMSRENCPDEELDLVGQYLTVNSILFKQYCTQQLAAGKTEAQISQLVAENGIKVMVRMVLIKQMSPEQHE